MINRNTSAIALSRTGLTSATKVVYDRNGAIVSSSHATTNDVSETPSRKYVTGPQLTILNNISGINTGDDAVNNLYSSLVGIPVGGTAGQVLSKIDGTDHNIQ